jgi:hypothetical protein
LVTLRTKRILPHQLERTTILSPESSSKRKENRSRDQDSGKGKETAEPPVSKQTKKKGRKLQFTPEVVEILKPGKPLTRSATKRLPIMDKQPVEHTTQEFNKDQIPSDEKDKTIMELQDHLEKSHHTIAQLQFENREMKKRIIEEAISTPKSKKDTTLSVKKTTPLSPDSSKRKKEKKSVEKSPEVVEVAKPSVPLTRYAAKQLDLMKKYEREPSTDDEPATILKIDTSPGEGESTIKRLKNQLREAQDTIIQLREEQRVHMKDAFEIINQCHEAIDNNKIL